MKHFVDEYAPEFGWRTIEKNAPFSKERSGVRRAIAVAKARHTADANRRSEKGRQPPQYP